MDNINLEVLKEIINVNESKKNKYFIIGAENGKPYLIDSKNEITKKDVYVIYCSGEGCSLSEDLGFYLYDELSFSQILIYEGGIPEWTSNNLPIE